MFVTSTHISLSFKNIRCINVKSNHVKKHEQRYYDLILKLSCLKQHKMLSSIFLRQCKMLSFMRASRCQRNDVGNHIIIANTRHDFSFVIVSYVLTCILISFSLGGTKEYMRSCNVWLQFTFLRILLHFL